MARSTASVARHLALWMSYEDVIRVADLKTRPERFAKLREEVGAKPEEPVHVTELLKPGIDEVSAILPPGLGAGCATGPSGAGAHRRLHLSMRPKSTSITGFPRLWLLARLRRWRPDSYRFAEEQEAIEAWLDAIARAAPSAPEFAREIAECARLLKGYSDTHRRGRDNYRRIFEGAIRPRLERPRAPLSRAPRARGGPRRSRRRGSEPGTRGHRRRTGRPDQRRRGVRRAIRLVAAAAL